MAGRKRQIVTALGVVWLALCPAGSAGAAVGAQPQALAGEQRRPLAQPASQPEAPRIDVSLARIRRMLRETPPTPRSGASSLLNLTYHVEVIGELPRINFLKGFNISRWSPVQYGGMTHDEFLREVAPAWRRTR